MGKRVIIFGTGEGGQEALAFFADNDSYEVVCFADNDPSKQGKAMSGFSIIPPMAIIDRNYDYVVIASMYYREIKQQLINEIGISDNNILFYINAYLAFYKDLYANGKHGQAQSVIEEGINLYGNDVRLSAVLAKCYRRANKHNEATSVIYKSLKARCPDFDSVLNKIENKINTRGGEVVSIYSFFNKGDLNNGFFQHVVENKGGKKKYITKICDRALGIHEMAFYENVAEKHEAFRAIIPSYIAHASSKCNNILFLTMEQLEGRHPRGKKDLSFVLSLFPVISGVRYRDLINRVEFSQDNAERANIKPTAVSISRLFSKVHELEANVTIINHIQDAVIQNNVSSAQVFACIQQLRNIIISKKAYHYVNPYTSYCLVHGDLNESNVIICGESVYVIDWSFFNLGPVGLDFAYYLSTHELSFEEIDEYFLSTAYGSELLDVERIIFVYSLITFRVVCFLQSKEKRGMARNLFLETELSKMIRYIEMCFSRL